MITAVTDDQIIQLSLDYGTMPVNAQKDEFSYLRDCCYYAYGFTILRSFGFSYNDARQKFNDAASVDGRYSNVPLDDNEIIEVTHRFISRYKLVGRYFHQGRVENSRDLIYWTIYYLRGKFSGKDQELALQIMENGMAEEANMPLPYPPPPVERLVTDGRLFRTTSGQPYIVKEVTAFNLVDKYGKGQSIDGFLNAFSKANTLRVFWYTPKSDWKDNAWDLPNPDTLIAFHSEVAQRGFYVENVCITDDDASLLPQIKNLINILKDSGLPNVMFEAVNEPYIHDKLEPSELKNVLNNTPYVYTSGIYVDEQISKFYGKYIVTHTPRDNEGVRKAKDLDELGDKYKIPATGNEPFRPDQGFSALDFYTYAALSNLMGNGSCFHYLDGELGNEPQGFDKECAEMFFKGFDVFPADACLGDYQHLQELEKVDANGNPTTALRVFRKGKYAIVVRNASVDIPSNWSSLDAYKVAYRID